MSDVFVIVLHSVSVYAEKIPFVKPAPIEEQENKKQKKSKDKKKNLEEGVQNMDIKK